MKLSLSTPDGRCATVEPWPAERWAVRLGDRYGTIEYLLTASRETAERLAREHTAPTPKDPR